MALANERNSQDHNMIPCSYYGSAFGRPNSPSPPIGFYNMEGYHKVAFEGAGMEKTCSSIKSNFASDLIDMQSGGSMLGGASSSSQDSQSVLEFKSTGSDDWAYSSGSFLSFEQGDNLSYTTSADKRSMNDFETAGGYGTHVRNPMDKVSHHGEDRFRWLCSGAVAQEDCYLEPEGIEGCFLKRPHPGGDVQSSKKQCTSGSATRKPKPKPAPAKDPQSVAAKNRRERISGRLKILQDLVPNGTKVDLVTMLEKAISYVKFLQLQVKVLATDEFWPAAGGKAPEVAQVKEAIDAILSSYKDRSSSSK